jgi:hypothetical protein
MAGPIEDLRGRLRQVQAPRNNDFTSSLRGRELDQMSPPSATDSANVDMPLQRRTQVQRERHLSVDTDTSGQFFLR